MKRPFHLLTLAVASALTAAPAFAADLPKATQDLLAKAKFDPSLLTGLDDELKMPKIGRAHV